jgi:hypothetical protein
VKLQAVEEKKLESEGLTPFILGENDFQTRSRFSSFGGKASV